MSIRPEVLPFLPAAVVVGMLVLAGLRLARRSWRAAVRAGLLFALVGCGFLLYFFRDPERVAPGDASAVVAGADGVIDRIALVSEDEFLHTQAVRISVFLGLLDVHVNRAPMAGEIAGLRTCPGEKRAAFRDTASDHNERNLILIRGGGTSCLVAQICGLAARRVVHWLEMGQHIRAGDRIGMMKFGSRLDIYLPKSDVTVLAREGQRVVAGETVIARLKGNPEP